MDKIMRLAMATLAAGALLGGATRAIGAEEEGGVTAEGACSATSFWHLTLVPEIGIHMEAEIESGVPDEPWQLRLSYNGHQMISVLEYTEDPDGAFEVFKVEKNDVGEDSVKLQARNVNTGETCWGLVEAEL